MQSNAIRSRRGFTLIELLVVIAIIAILAAILFPVFAQAREKARAASCLSNTKQIGLSVLMYVQDYDEMFPINHVEGFWADGVNDLNWARSVQPYVKNFQIFRCPDDSVASPDWEGIALSYGANSYYTYAAGDGASQDFKGVIPMILDYDMNGVPDTEGIWIHPNSAASLARVTRPADSIMVCERYDSDVYQNTGWAGNTTGVSAMSMVYGMGDFWGPGLIPDGGKPGIPERYDGDKPKAYPDGPEGAVKPHHNEQANFVFVDGHSKAMRPVQTNPDGANRPLDNMWDATR
jgi:prepilin-type N-terminal cleavage/methylation domain-containing protein/prepilin-type processing-associated H-X9-DG protein